MLLTMTVHPSIIDHPSTCLADGISPTWRRLQDLSTAGIFPTRRTICTFRWWDFPHSEMLTQTCQRTISRPSYGVKTFRCEIPPLRVTHSAAGIFPSQIPIWCSVDEDFLHSEYELPSSEPTGRWTPGSFSLSGLHPSIFRCREYPYSRASVFRWWDFSHLGASFVVRFPSHGGQLRCWVYSHLEVSDRHIGWGAISGKDASNRSLGDIPTLDHFLLAQWDCDYTWYGIFMRVSLFGLSPRHTSSE